VNTTEERLRAAARAVAGTVPSESMPPLRLPAAQPQQAGPRGRQRRWPDWLTPLSAAAAVIAVIAMSVAVTRGPLSGPNARADAGPDGTPPYYVALTAAGHAGAAAVIRRTATGAPVARVAPPRPSNGFTMVSGAADDRTFVLGAQVTLPAASQSYAPFGSSRPEYSYAAQNQMRLVTFTEFQLLRFDAARQQARLSPLHLPPVTQAVSGLALSPDGTRLAVALSRPGQLKITVSTLATGSSRTWAAHLNRDLPPWLPNSLYWARDERTLAFSWPEPAGRRKGAVPLAESVRLLDTAAPGTSLLADSVTAPRVVAAPRVTGNLPALPNRGPPITFSGQLFPDGETAGYTLRVLGAYPGPGSGHDVRDYILTVTPPLWVNSTGSVQIVSILRRAIGIVGHGRYVNLPAAMPANQLGIAW
jgi:hypothetical protein